MVLFHYSFVLLHRFLIVSNMRKIIGRERELYDLQRCLDSDKSEFVVVYGRRVGKRHHVHPFTTLHYFNVSIIPLNACDASRLKNISIFQRFRSALCDA